MRQLGDRLSQAFKPAEPHLVDENRHDNSSRNPEQEFVKADQKRIDDDVDKVGALENRDKVLKADPGATADPF